MGAVDTNVGSLLNEVLSITAQESVACAYVGLSGLSSMKS